VLSLIVEDHPGVLERVASQVRRRGFNIEALSVGPVDAGRSRMTVAVDAGHAEVDQVAKQLDRLIEVIEVEDITDGPTVKRELMVARVGQVPAVVEQYGARRIADGLVELTADTDTIDEFIEFLAPYGIEELARTGPVAMKRSA
jgi:acetolactate synthase-1/3 small subunit